MIRLATLAELRDWQELESLSKTKKMSGGFEVLFTKLPTNNSCLISRVPGNCRTLWKSACSIRTYRKRKNICQK